MTVNRIDLYLGGQIGLWALQHVSAQNVSGVITHDPEISKTALAAGLTVCQPDTANHDACVRSDIGFSVHYPRIVKSEVLSRYRKVYNLHPGFLPWGRGFYPVFWALWEQSPAGATMHEMTANIDEGPIVAQIAVTYDAHDTGGSLHQRVQDAEKQIFREYWPRLVGGELLSAFAQTKHQGSYHPKKEFFALKQQAPLEKLSAKEMLHLIRCLTFPGFSGLEVSLGERKFHVELQSLPSAVEQ